mgnify:CR=1 FL=1
MFKIWANLSLLIGLAILGGIVWFIVYIAAKVFFEDIVGSTFKKIKRRAEKEEDDQYIY